MRKELFLLLALVSLASALDSCFDYVQVLSAGQVFLPNGPTDGLTKFNALRVNSRITEDNRFKFENNVSHSYFYLSSQSYLQNGPASIYYKYTPGPSDQYFTTQSLPVQYTCKGKAADSLSVSFKQLSGIFYAANLTRYKPLEISTALITSPKDDAFLLPDWSNQKSFYVTLNNSGDVFTGTIFFEASPGVFIASIHKQVQYVGCCSANEKKAFCKTFTDQENYCLDSDGLKYDSCEANSAASYTCQKDRCVKAIVACKDTCSESKCVETTQNTPAPTNTPSSTLQVTASATPASPTASINPASKAPASLFGFDLNLAIAAIISILVVGYFALGKKR